MLVSEFSVMETEEALHDTNSNKAPGPDGINAGVLKEVWKYVKKEVFDFFSNFHSKNYIPAGLNSSFIALVPKTPNPSKAVDYRPISLMNFVMKLLSKVLAKSRGKVIGGLVSETQSTFVKGKQILDCILLSTELH